MQSPNPSRRSSSPTKILVAEDAPDLREAIVEILLEQGYEVETADDGYEATTLFREYSPDLVILDDRMPMMNGVDVCTVIRRTSDVPIIMFTASDDVAKVQGAIENGATDFVLKTTGIDELAERVASHLGKRLSPIHDDNRIKAVETAPVSGPTKITTTTLIVDPDEQSRSVIIPALARRGQNYIEVESAADASTAVQRFDPDILIIEWSLPGEDVFKMLAEMKHGARSKQKVRVIMSDRITYEIERKCRFLGVDKFLKKPLNASVTELMIGECLREAVCKIKGETWQRP